MMSFGTPSPFFPLTTSLALDAAIPRVEITRQPTDAMFLQGGSLSRDFFEFDY